MGNHHDDSSWKFGLFYYNKKDKRLFPPKRFGFGWTVNFANPLSVIALIVIIILLFLISRLIKG